MLAFVKEKLGFPKEKLGFPKEKLGIPGNGAKKCCSDLLSHASQESRKLPRFRDEKREREWRSQLKALSHLTCHLRLASECESS